MQTFFSNTEKKAKTVNFLLFIPDYVSFVNKGIDDGNENNRPYASITYVYTLDSISEFCLIGQYLDFN